MLRFFFRKPTDPAVTRHYQAAVAQARQPTFYQKFGVADTVEGRFEMVVFHVCALIDRLRDGNGALTDHGQALFDAFVADMEDNLRTIGIGDMSVPKTMKKIGSAFYGRFDAYRAAARRGDRAGLAAAIARNVFGDESGRAGSRECLALADYYVALTAAAPAAIDGPAAPLPDPDDFAPRTPADASEAAFAEVGR
ncbi:ubiquinol-cytochrome C chaperone family protein [Acuticoccus mangrovi]|uniref:Ubiquinol-cytochrome C chaperone n=1 Tax=Acuticoccus mangrovi TaxID=2796142 RepID=A0A934IK66_9HYPH|nr:ubiquinol-cytochrome C chaperone family protein [Acuticoccus mangrovi]MBJ3776491.1 ubiquinol-cytochrome C chaperone [Acuticoccus mangrovi]